MGLSFFILGKFGFGKKLFHGSCFYSNGTNSEYFQLHRSTRQGLPLSLLLFAIVMEPLSIALRSHPDICGITRDGVKLKVALYADDLLLFLSNLSRSIRAALLVREEFGRFSGYKLSLDKSEVFTVNGEVNENSRQLQEQVLPNLLIIGQQTLEI